MADEAKGNSNTVAAEFLEILREPGFGEAEPESSTIKVDTDGDGKPDVTVKGGNVTVEVDTDGDGKPDVTITNKEPDSGFKLPEDFEPDYLVPKDELPEFHGDPGIDPNYKGEFELPEGEFILPEGWEKMPDEFPKRMPEEFDKLPEVEPENNTLKIDTDNDGVTDVTVKGDGVTVELDIDDDGVTDVTIKKEGDTITIDADGDGEPETTIIGKDVTYGVDVDGDGTTDITIQNKAPEPDSGFKLPEGFKLPDHDWEKMPDEDFPKRMPEFEMLPDGRIVPIDPNPEGFEKLPDGLEGFDPSDLDKLFPSEEHEMNPDVYLPIYIPEYDEDGNEIPPKLETGPYYPNEDNSQPELMECSAGTKQFEDFFKPEALTIQDLSKVYNESATGTTPEAEVKLDETAPSTPAALVTM